MEVLGEGGRLNVMVALHQELAAIEGGERAWVGERFPALKSGEEL